MTLTEFYNMMYRSDYSRTSREPKLLVFSSEDDWDSYRNSAGDGVMPDAVICSGLTLDTVLSPRYAQAEVMHFSALGRDMIDVIVHLKEGDE